MDLSDPVRSVIPSLDGPVLSALTRSTSPANLTTVHRRAGTGSISGVRKVLERLVAHGLVLQEPGGYRLNQQHLAAPAIETLTSLHARFAERLRDWIAERPEEVIAAGVFGSMARRDGTTESDIDLLVITASGSGDELRSDLAGAVASWTGNPAHVVVLTRGEVADLRLRDQPIADSWRREIEMIIGDRQEVTG